LFYYRYRLEAPVKKEACGISIELTRIIRAKRLPRPACPEYNNWGI
jgi:hypothetical protein